MSLPQNDSRNLVNGQKPTFDPNRHLIKVQGGRSYLPVSARLIWFRSEHPDWGIETEPITIDSEKNFAIFRARIYNAEGRLMAMGTKKEDIKGFGDYIEKAETGAVGRALALCGYGTQFAPDLDEVSGGRLADAPQGGGRDNRGGQRGGGHPGARPASDFSRPQGRRPDRAGAAASRDDSCATAQHACTACPKTVNKSQAESSQHNFGKILCLGCQKDARNAAAGVPAAAFVTQRGRPQQEGASR